MKKIKTGIFGAAGLSGIELIGLLKQHTHFDLQFISSDRYKGMTLGGFYSAFQNADFPWSSLVFSSNADRPKDLELLFLATPNDVSVELVEYYYGQENAPVIIDFSGAYRLKDLEMAKKFYKLEYKKPELLQKAVTGFPEWNYEKIASSNLIANPGCYPTSVSAPLKLLIQATKTLGFVIDEKAGIIIDAKSGVSGAGGRVVGGGFSFNDTYENFRAYKILTHQHEPEILQEVQGFLVDDDSLGTFSAFNDLVFTPHLLPLSRGILSTIYLNLKENYGLANTDSFVSANREVESSIKDCVRDILDKDDRNKKNFHFIRLKENPEDVELRNVQYTNQLVFSFRLRGNRLVIVSAIDNLRKGAAGQALQNANIRFGYSSYIGLN